MADPFPSWLFRNCPATCFTVELMRVSFYDFYPEGAIMYKSKQGCKIFIFKVVVELCFSYGLGL